MASTKFDYNPMDMGLFEITKFSEECETNLPSTC